MSASPLALDYASPTPRAGRPRWLSRGQAAVELALCMPLLLALFIAVAETGRAFYIAISVSNAARAGVQYGAQNLSTAGDDAGMRQAAINDAPNIAGMTVIATHFCKCSDGSASTCLSTDCTGGYRLLYAQVNTSAQYTPVINYAGIMHTTTVPGLAVMRVIQ